MASKINKSKLFYVREIPFIAFPTFCRLCFCEHRREEEGGKTSKEFKKKKKNWSNKEFLILEAKFWFKINLKHSSYAFFW